jgi:NADPH:quinone reductase-like Zn-dependent oxidoreductase
LQFAKAQGAKVIITSGRDEKLVRVQQLGADYTINYKTTPNWEVVVQEMTNGEGADLIVETVGGDNLKQSIAALRMGGHISIMGMLNGLEIGLDALVLLIKQVTIRGMEVGSKSDFEVMNQAILTNDVHPVVDAKFTLDQIQAAFEYLEKAQHFGKVVITL